MKFSKKSLILLASLLLAVTLTVGGTLAFLIDTTDAVENTFTPSRVTTEVEETFDGETKKDVTIKNTGDTDAYIRAAIVITWKNEAGNVYGKAPVKDTDYSIALDLNNGWKLGDDGFYYWTKPVASDGETGVLITSCSQLKECENSDYKLNVEIIGSGIQSKPESAVKDAWGFVPGT